MWKVLHCLTGDESHAAFSPRQMLIRDTVLEVVSASNKKSCTSTVATGRNSMASVL